VAKIINDKGCLLAGEEWMEKNLVVVVGVVVGIAFLQVNTFNSNTIYVIEWLNIIRSVCPTSFYERNILSADDYSPIFNQLTPVFFIDSWHLLRPEFTR